MKYFIVQKWKKDCCKPPPSLSVDPNSIDAWSCFSEGSCLVKAAAYWHRTQAKLNSSS